MNFFVERPHLGDERDDFYEVEIVHLGTDKPRIAEAERAGVKSVPALLLDGHPFHINFGAPLSALR